MIISNTRADFLLNYRLYRHGLRPLDVGGGGDCFFKSVSHQLFGDSSHHLAIRYTAVQYLRENPERFIESVVDRSWSQYLHSMSMQGTWADRTVIQAVAVCTLKTNNSSNFHHSTQVPVTTCPLRGLLF